MVDTERLEGNIRHALVKYVEATTIRWWILKDVVPILSRLLMIG